MEGFNATIFAYGQSGSGKTFSMLGPEAVTEVLVNQSSNINEELEALFGIVPRATFQIFDLIEAGKAKGTRYTVKVSYLEIYNEAINDILKIPVTHNLKIREFPNQGMCVIGMHEATVTCPENVFECISAGTVNKIVCSTGQNSRSSRSHTVFILTCEQFLLDGTSKFSKINLVDLAGSEKLSKTGAQGQALKEAQKINLSLTTLGRCIKALTGKPGEHVPFRESKLTLILKESLGGNSKTSLVVTGSMRKIHQDETLSTLKFAERAKLVKTAARSNVKRSVEELELLVEQLKAEIGRLKNQIKSGGIGLVDDSEELQELRVKYEMMQSSYSKQIEELTDAVERNRAGSIENDYQEERNRLINRISELENENFRREEQRIGVEKNKQAIYIELEKLKNENLELKQKVKSSQEYVDILKNDLKVIELEKDEIKNEMSLKLQESADYIEMIRDYRNDILESQRKNEELSVELEEVVAIMENLQREKNESLEAIEKLKTDSHDLKEKLDEKKNSWKEKFSKLKQKINDLQLENDQFKQGLILSQSAEELVNENSRLKSELASFTANSETKTLVSELSKTQAELLKLSQEKQSMLQDLTAFRDSLKRNEEILRCRESFAQIFSALEHKNAMLERQLANEEKARTQLTKSIKFYEENREKLIKDIENSLRTKMQVSINSLNRKENELMAKLRQKELEIEEIKGKEDSNKTKAELNASLSKVAHLNLELKNVIQEFDLKTNQFLQEKENWKIVNLEKMNENLQLKMEVAEKESKINSLKKELMNLQGILQSKHTDETEVSNEGDPSKKRDSRNLFKKQVEKIQRVRINTLYHNPDSANP